MNTTQLGSHAEKTIHQSSGDLKDFRLTHLAQFQKQGFKCDPEFYKFTNLNSLVENLSDSEQDPGAFSVSGFESNDFHDILFIDGQLTKTPTIPGVAIQSITEAFHQVASELKNLGALSTLHHAMLESGVRIEVAKNTKLERPIRILHLINRSGVVAPTLFIKLQPLSEASLVEEIHAQDVDDLFISETYSQIEAGAKLEHVVLNAGGKTSVHHNSSLATIQRDATYRNVALTLSGKAFRYNMGTKLKDSGARGESYNLYLAHALEHTDINTCIEHMAADTSSDQIAKGILDGESKGIFTGKIHIHPKAQRVASSQLNKNLLLSKKAQAHSQPQLEIFADDVKCSHGSTTGQLSDDEVFYFQARGIPADKARTLLAHGFGLEVVQKIENKVIATRLETLVMNALKEKFQLGGNE